MILLFISVNLVFFCTFWFLFVGNFEEAIKAFTEAIKKNPHSANLYAKRARWAYFVSCYHMHYLKIKTWKTSSQNVTLILDWNTNWSKLNK